MEQDKKKGLSFEHEPLAGQLILFAKPPEEEDEDGASIALEVPPEATLPLLRALRRSLEATPRAEVNGDRTLWSTLFERFGAGGNDLVAPSECSVCGEGCEALRVRLAAAEARLAAATTRHAEELQELQEALTAKIRQSDDLPKRSTACRMRPPRTARTPPRQTHAGVLEEPEDQAVIQDEQEHPTQNFSLSAEFWRLREALAVAEASEHQKASDLEVRRLRTALATTTAKLERYEATSLEDTQRVSTISLSERLATTRGANHKVLERKPDLFPQAAEPDTARTVVAGQEVPAERQPSPGKPRQSQLGGSGTLIRPLSRTSTSFISPARLSPCLAPRSSSPAGPRRTVAELAASPPQRPVQLSPYHVRRAAGGSTSLKQAASPPAPAGRATGDSAPTSWTPAASARVPGPLVVPQAHQAASVAAPMRVYNVPVVRSVQAPVQAPAQTAGVRVVSNMQGTASAPPSSLWTTPRPPVTAVVQRVTPPPLAAMRKSATIARTGSLSPPPMFAHREYTSPPGVRLQSKAQMVELSV